MAAAASRSKRGCAVEHPALASVEMSNVVGEETYDMAPVNPASGPHHFFGYVGATPEKSVIRDLALQLANHYFRVGRSRNQWAKAVPAVCRWESSIRAQDGTVTPVEQASVPLHLRDFERELTSGTFDFQKLSLPDPMCFWLDSSVSLSPNFQARANSGTHALTFAAAPNLGPGFPIVPAIDREGALYTSFQTILLRRIANVRRQLIENSMAPGEEEWFQGFRTLVSECVSLVENTLHQIYFKAEFDPLPGWTFDRAALGERHGRRLVDKLKWVFQITRRELHARDELRALETVKMLRNHLQHFDPPSFACTWEEVAEWLNDVLLVVHLGRKIRAVVQALPSVAMLELLLQRRAVFRPRDPGRTRVPRNRALGYASASEAALRSSRPVRQNQIFLQALPPPRLL